MINAKGEKSRVEKSYCFILSWFFLAIDHWLLTIAHASLFFFLRFAPEQDAMGVRDLDSFLIEPVLNSFP